MNAIKLQRKYPQFKQEDIYGLINEFRKIDVDDKGSVDQQTVIKACQASEQGATYDGIRAALKECNLDSTGRVELDDYVELISKVRGPGAAAAGGIEVNRQKIKVAGSNANVSHTINEDERTEFTRHINGVLAGDTDVGARLPFPTDTFEMFDQCKDGLVLSKLINDAVPDTIDERVLNKTKGSKKLNNFTMTENNNIVISSAKSLGLSVVNIGAQDLMEGREHLILGLIWQIIRRGLLSKIDIKLHPELYRLLDEDETIEQFLRLPPEQILLRWFNYHLKAAGWQRRVNNFSSDVSDGENYTILLNQLKPEHCSRSPLQIKDLHKRAEEVLQNADKIDCRKYLTPTALVAGNPKLNLAFVANLFNTHPCLEPLDETEKPEIEDFDAEGEREARVFTLWLNSLDVQPAVHNLFEDVRDGVVLLQAYDKIKPDTVNWRHASKRPADREMSRFKAVENTNYAVDLGLQNRFSLVGIQGADIVDGSRIAILSIGWQLMRKDLTETLKRLASKMGGEVTDQQILKWANATANGKSTIRSFGDPSIHTGKFLLDLLNGINSSYVDYDIVTDGRSDEDAYSNARLAISIARKLGTTIFLLPEDIVAVRQKLIWTFIASLMAQAHSKR
ncbi:Fimbrin [Taphrina deformans PYCC 5710]|uniref:Fimbrin n=1 Tax=Taphrina deformans (strain PYCC 5710 / ATCC 11124 / CBS 356.35 / IMI 108563 / JCM 9778 / NBRC 8474) TaxID=1097556 RepID=R4X6C9_TAPDE|nr:Fimbrin [Taphrina deformans PYCC 5710]|eukprot:CCG80580.1 Fimbrin [Taphrina deformans PYCC 5710]